MPPTIMESGRGFERIGAHSHIKGLGLTSEGKALASADGMVGQIEAREAAGLIVEMIKEGRMAGRGILLVGPPGTGKTAIAIAIAKELGEDTPFVSLSASEVYSAEMKKTEVLMQAMRKAIGVRIREIRKVYEGVVKNMKVAFKRHPYNPYYKVPSSAKITLATRDEEKTFTVDRDITLELLNKGVGIGDVIWIDSETGRITKIGKVRGFEKAKYYDLETEVLVEMPKGPILKEKEFIHTVTLHDLDVGMASRRGIISIFFGMPTEREISSEVRREVDEEVKKLVDEGRAEIIPGVLFIDDAHMLDIECFAFLGRAMESELAPIIILATNRGITRIRGTDIESPHGMPLDLLDRLLIIRTKPYTRDEIREILKIRSKATKIKLTDGALERLTEIGAETSLRYAVQLMEPAWERARVLNRDYVDVEDIEYVRKLFVDVKESSKYAKDFEKQFLR
ncbi:MAG: TATA box-binding protein [Thermoprotei archaeon]|nr:MAG: TATA box-binding protein [Thermoprotei archaeon]